MIRRHTVIAVLVVLLGLALVPGAQAQQPKRGGVLRIA